VSSRTPWHKHKFSPGKTTPKSCIVCSGTEDAVQHQPEKAPAVPAPKPPPTPQESLICWKCNVAPGRRIPENGAVLCAGCEQIMKP
jgi:hypothetical protein